MSSPDPDPTHLRVIITGYSDDQVTNLTIFTLTNGYYTAEIGDNAFQYFDKLQSITINGFVTRIGANAFFGCTALTSISFIGGYVTSIGDSAFSGCSSLTSITIPTAVTSIGNSVFDHCSSLTSITIPTAVTSIGNNAFDSCILLTSITIPALVTSIGEYAFSFCSVLTSVTFTAVPQLASIGRNAFSSCSILTSITIPALVTSIERNAFSACIALTSVTFLGLRPSVVGVFVFISTNVSLIITVPCSWTTDTLSGKPVTRGVSGMCTSSSITVPTVGPYTYDGNPQGPNSGFVVTGSSGAVSYSYVGTGITVYLASATRPSAVGSYTATATVYGDASYDSATSDPLPFTIVLGGGSGGDPYVTTISNIRYKLPAMNAPIRFYQGIVNGKLLTINAQLRTTPNSDMIADNIRSYFDFKHKVPAHKLKELEYAVYANEDLCFYEKFYVSYNGSELVINVWDHKFKIEKYKGKIASETSTRTDLISLCTGAYDKYDSNTLKFTLGSANLYITVYPNKLVRNSIYLEATGISSGNGVIVNTLSVKHMTLESLDSHVAVVKKDSAMKEKEEWFLDHVDYRKRKFYIAH